MKIIALCGVAFLVHESKVLEVGENNEIRRANFEYVLERVCLGMERERALAENKSGGSTLH